MTITSDIIRCELKDMEIIFASIKQTKKDAFFTIDNDQLKHLKSNEIDQTLKGGKQVFYVKASKRSHNLIPKEYVLAQVATFFLPHQPNHLIKNLSYKDEAKNSKFITVLLSQVHPNTKFSNGKVAHQNKIDKEFLLKVSPQITLSYILGNDDLKEDAIVSIQHEVQIYTLLDFARCLIPENFYIPMVSPNSMPSLDACAILLGNYPDNSMLVRNGLIDKKMFDQIENDEDFKTKFEAKSNELYVAFTIFNFDSIYSLHLIDYAEAVLENIIKALKNIQNMVLHLLREKYQSDKKLYWQAIYHKAKTNLLTVKKDRLQKVFHNKIIQDESVKEPSNKYGMIALLLLIFVGCLTTTLFYPSWLITISLTSLALISIIGIILLNQSTSLKLPILEISDLDKNTDDANSVVNELFRFQNADCFIKNLNAEASASDEKQSADRLFS